MEQSHVVKPFEAYRATFAPVLRAQQEGLKTWSRFVRLQFTIVGDLLEHNLAGVQAMVSAATPVEYLAKQGQLNVRFIDKVATHTREFLNEAADRSASEIAASMDVVLPTVQEEIINVEEEEQVAAQLLEDGEIREDEPSSESIEEPAAPSTPKSTTSKQGGKRSDKSRRGQAHH